MGSELKRPIPGVPTHQTTLPLRLQATWQPLPTHRAKPHLAQLHKRYWTIPTSTGSVPMLNT